jgi:hypothetical protein
MSAKNSPASVAAAGPANRKNVYHASGLYTEERAMVAYLSELTVLGMAALRESRSSGCDRQHLASSAESSRPAIVTALGNDRRPMSDSAG